MKRPVFMRIEYRDNTGLPIRAVQRLIIIDTRDPQRGQKIINHATQTALILDAAIDAQHNKKPRSST
jgi:hypothetical protein